MENETIEPTIGEDERIEPTIGEHERIEDMIARTLHDKHIVLKYIGEGSYAKVYLIKHKNLNQRRALKLIKKPFTSDSDNEKIFREAKMSVGLHHKNIIDIYDADKIYTYGIDSNGYYVLEKREGVRPDIWLYIISEYVSGIDLEEYRQSLTDDKNKIAIDEVISIIKQILEGLNVLHTTDPPTLHRDLKTENILTHRDSNNNIEVKITDFGFAQEVTPDKNDGVLGGTKEYMAPEIFKNNNKDKYSTQSDVYAVGVIFYLLLTNQFPHNIKDYTQADMAVYDWDTPVKAPSSYDNNIPKTLDEIILKSLSINPKQRYKDANEFLKAIEEVPNITANDNEIIDNTPSPERNPHENQKSKTYENTDNAITSNDLSKIKTIAGAISIIVGILIYLNKAYYAEWYFVLLIIPTVGLIIQRNSVKNNRIMGAIIFSLGIIILYLSINSYLNVYHILTNLYLTNQINHIPTTSEVNSYINTYLMIIAYALYNMICGLLLTFYQSIHPNPMKIND